MSVISREQGWELITALGRPITMMILANLCAGVQQRAIGPVVNNTQPIYAANNKYDEAIDTLLSQLYRNTLSRHFLSYRSMFILYGKKVSIILMTWRNLTVLNSKL